MAPFNNPELLLRVLQQRTSASPADPNFSVLDPSFISQGAAPTKPDSSTGMLSPAGVAPGGPGTAMGAGASTPRNPAIIQDPNSIERMHSEIMRRLTEPVEIGAPPEAPNFPAPPTMAPLRGGVVGRLVAGLSGFGGAPNPFEVQRRQQFQDALEQWQSQVSPLQTSYQDKLRAYAEQMKAKTEAAQAQRYGAMAASYMAPYFGISRSGTQMGGASKVSNALKFNQGMPVSVTDPQNPSQTYPIDPSDKNLEQIPDHLKPLVLAAQRQHGAWYQEQQRLIQTRGEAFRLNTMYPVLDAEDGMAPVMARGYEILNNPGRYNAGSLGQMAMNKENVLLDIGDMSKLTREAFHAIGNEGFSGQQRAMIATALAAPAGTAEQYLQSFARAGLSPAQMLYVTRAIQLKENAMALRGIPGMGGSTDMMKQAVSNTLVGAGTPDMAYGDAQFDALDQQIARLRRGVPKTAVRAGGDIPQAGEGATPPVPARGPLASQKQPPALPLNARTAPHNIRQQAQPASPQDIERVPIINPQGQRGTVPSSQLADALAQGYKQVQ